MNVTGTRLLTLRGRRVVYLTIPWSPPLIPALNRLHLQKTLLFATIQLHDSAQLPIKT